MLAVGIVFLVLLFIALLRFGTIVEYSDVGLNVWVTVGPFRFSLLSATKEKRVRKERKVKKRTKNKKPKSLKEKRVRAKPPLKVVIRAVMKSLSRLKRRLLIKHFVFNCTLSGSDPLSVIKQYGIVNAVFGLITPSLMQNPRVRHHNLRVSCDFSEFSSRIYAKFAISIAVWEVLYIAFALLPLLFVKPVTSKAASSPEPPAADDITHSK